jgi:hypothetical protein
VIRDPSFDISLVSLKRRESVDSGVINEDLDLAEAGSVEGSCSHEIMGLGEEEPSFDYAQHSHSRRCDSFPS